TPRPARRARAPSLLRPAASRLPARATSRSCRLALHKQVARASPGTAAARRPGWRWTHDAARARESVLRPDVDAFQPATVGDVGQLHLHGGAGVVEALDAIVRPGVAQLQHHLAVDDLDVLDHVDVIVHQAILRG